MPDQNKPAPIQALVFGQLSHEENVELARRAMEEEGGFDGVWEAREQREILQDPAARKRLLRTLEQKQKEKWWERARAWLFTPFNRFVLIGAGGLAVAVLIWLGQDRGSRDRSEFKTATVS